MRTIACLSMTALVLAASIGTVAAEQLKFTVTSMSPNAVELEFRSAKRKTHSWPGPGRVYKLEDSEPHAYAISCEPGEQVCYGAWVQGDYETFWGVGHAYSHRCNKCCYTCDGTSPKVTLNK